MTIAAAGMKPQFVLVRPNGTFVPLLPTDELPLTLVIEGVPRSMTQEETAGMHNLGHVEPRHLTFAAKLVENPPKSNGVSHDRTLSGSQWANLTYIPPKPDRPAPRVVIGIEEQPPSRTPQPSPGGTLPKPLPSWHTETLLQTEGVKEYCSFWVRRGECDFAQAGCRYKHEMPIDIPTLNSIGLRDIPEWYRRHYGVRSLLAADTAPNISSHSGWGHPGRPRSRHASSGSWRQQETEVLITTDEDTSDDRQVREWTTVPLRDVRVGRRVADIQTPPSGGRRVLATSSHTSSPQPKKGNTVETLAQKQNREVLKQLEAEEASRNKLNDMYKPLHPITTNSFSESRVATPSTETPSSAISSFDEEDATVKVHRSTRADSVTSERGGRNQGGRRIISGRSRRGGRGGRVAGRK